MSDKNFLSQAAYQVQMVPTKDLIPTLENPREIDPKDPVLMELVKSVRSQGILVPLLARPHPSKKGRFDLRAGARRLMAACLAGLEKVPVLIRAMSDQEALELTVTENLQRESLTPLEEAKGIDLLVSRGWRIEDVAAHIGKTARWAYRRARLIHLSEKWRKAARDPSRRFKHWPASNLELIARLDPDVQDYLLKEWERDWRAKDDITAADLDRLITNYTHELARALWDLEDAKIGKGPACSKCLRRSSCRPTLFEEINLEDPKEAKRDRCLDPRCWDAKLADYTQTKASELKAQHGKVLLARDGFGFNNKPIINAKETVNENQIQKSKADAAGAVPVLLVSGPKAGTWSYGKIKSNAPERREKKSVEESHGDPEARKNVATSFACAQVALVVCMDPGRKNDPVFTSSSKHPVSLACLDSFVMENFLGGYRDRYAHAQEWLRISVGLGVHAQDDGFLIDGSDTAKNAQASFDLPESATIQEYAQYIKKSNDLAVNLDRLFTFGLFSYFITLTNLRDQDPFAGIIKVPEAVLKVARQTFEIPRMMLDCHQKADLLEIGRSLLLPVTAGMRREAIIEKIMSANLLPGTLTPELAEAFGAKRKVSDLTLGEIRARIKKAKKK